MKYLAIILGLVISCSPTSRWTSYYQLVGSNADKDFLVKTIKDYKKRGFNYEYPSVVVDGYLFKANLRSITSLKLKKCELKQIYFLSPIVAKNLFRENGLDGIILIHTKKCDDNKELEISDNLDYNGEELPSR